MAGEVVFGEESFVAFLTDKVSSALVRVHVLLQVVGLEEVFVTLRALYAALTVVEKGNRMKTTHALHTTSIFTLLQRNSAV